MPTGHVRPPQQPHIIVDPGRDHLQQVRDELDRLAAVVVGAPASVNVMVELIPVLHPGMFTALLHGFWILDASDVTGRSDTTDSNDVVRLAVIANRPSELIVESVVDGLATLVARRIELAAKVNAGDDLIGFDERVGVIDTAAREATVDVLRHGWVHAAEQVVRQAIAGGICLTVRVTDEAFTITERRARYQILRGVYNEIPMARDVVDRLVGAIAGRRLSVRSGGATETARQFVESHTDAAMVSRYFQHALRDAFALGDGYAAFTDDEPIGTYCVRPETQLGVDATKGRTVSDGNPSAPLVFHGVEQVDSHYGLSIIEVIMPSVQQLRLAQSLTDRAQPFFDSPVREQRDYANRSVAMARRLQEQVPDDIGRMFAPILDNLPV